MNKINKYLELIKNPKESIFIKKLVLINGKPIVFIRLNTK